MQHAGMAWTGIVLALMAASVVGCAARRGAAEDSLLGSDAPLQWRRTADGLTVDLPAQKPCGQVVGYAETAGYSGCQHAFLWDPATGIGDLGAFGLYYSHAYGINDAGQIIGWAASAAAGPHLWFLYDGATVLDVRDLVPAEVRSMVGPPNDINNVGQLVGGSPAYLMTLVPEPGTPKVRNAVAQAGAEREGSPVTGCENLRQEVGH